MHTLTGIEFEACVAAAVKAPSIHNTQPWLFLAGPDAIEVHADLSRRLPAIDPTGRALHISLGAAVLNIRVALAGHGRHARTELLPDPRDTRHVATVGAGEPRPVGPDDRELLAAVDRRRSNRGPFDDTPPPAPDLDALVAAARQEGALLRVAEPAARDGLLNLARTAEARQRQNPAYRAELRRWTTDDPYREDGVPLEAVGPWSTTQDMPVRDFAPERDIPGRQAVRFEQQPTVATLATHGDGPEQWLAAGQALQRVLLEATRRGLVASLFTQPVEDPELRDLLRDSLRDGEPLTSVQVVLRVGYGPPAPASPRRPPKEVIAHTRPAPMRPPRLG
jgi:nitroreductase